MHRGSAAGVLFERGFCANPAIPPQRPQKRGLPTFSQFSEATLHIEGCPLRRVLQQGFGRSAAQKRGRGGDVRLKSVGHVLLFLLP